MSEMRRSEEFILVVFKQKGQVDKYKCQNILLKFHGSHEGVKTVCSFALLRKQDMILCRFKYPKIVDFVYCTKKPGSGKAPKKVGSKTEQITNVA